MCSCRPSNFATLTRDKPIEFGRWGLRVASWPTLTLARGGLTLVFLLADRSVLAWNSKMIQAWLYSSIPSNVSLGISNSMIPLDDGTNWACRGVPMRLVKGDITVPICLRWYPAPPSDGLDCFVADRSLTSARILPVRSACFSCLNFDSSLVTVRTWYRYSSTEKDTVAAQDATQGELLAVAIVDYEYGTDLSVFLRSHNMFQQNEHALTFYRSFGYGPIRFTVTGTFGHRYCRPVRYTGPNWWLSS